MRKYLVSISCLIFVLFVSSGAGAQTIAAPPVKIAGLGQSVTVRRDARSIPYIEAKTDADLYFAQGYVTASDRLWQMDLLRRVARGELAEIFGKQVLEEDKRWRRYGFAKIAEDSLTTLNPQLKTALENYARGVNAYIATLDKETLPVEFKILQYSPREWKPTDTIVVGKILADALSSTWQQDLIRASLKDLPAEKLADLTNQVTPYDVVLFGKDAAADRKEKGLEPKSRVDVTAGDLAAAANETAVRENSLARIGFFAEELAASNNWVISGKRTIDGKPLLANDPHLLAAAPGIWYLTHLTAPGMRVSGVTFPGVPGIVLGHNESIAWGATNVGPDVQDLYREEFDAAGRYKTPNGWENVTVRKEEIKVRKNPLAPETETQTIEVQETRNGVVITDEIGQKFALKWTARDPKNQEFEAFFLLNRAKNWAEFENALKTYGGAAQNFVYADTAGNIGWYAAGRIPLRRTGDGSLPYNGATDEGEWTGYIPFGELPHLYNPPENFIVTANQRLVGTDYRYFSVISRDAAMPWRARRIYDLIAANRKISINDVRDIQHDVFNIPFSNLARDLAALGASADVKRILQGWDGKMTADAKAPLVVNEIRNCLVDKLAQDNKPAPAWVIRERILYRAIREKSALWLPKNFAGYEEMVAACETASLAALQKKYGADETKWRWGDAFVANFQHPLSIAPLIGGQFAVKFTNVNGSGQTPNVGPYVSMRHIASPGNWDETRHVIPLGQSGNPASDHWKDQFEAWRTGSPQIFPFSKEAVERSAKEIVVFSGK
jgi:penicillin G amidase